MKSCAKMPEMAICQAKTADEIRKCDHRRGFGNGYNVERDILCSYCGYRAPASNPGGSTCNCSTAHNEALVAEIMSRKITISDIVIWLQQYLKEKSDE